MSLALPVLILAGIVFFLVFIERIMSRGSVRPLRSLKIVLTKQLVHRALKPFDLSLTVLLQLNPKP